MSKWLSSKSTRIANGGEDVEKGKSLYTVGGNVSCVATVEYNMKFAPKTKN